GLILGCNLVKFKSLKGALLPQKGRLFTLLVSVAWHAIWNLRQTRVIKNPESTLTEAHIHDYWLKAVNTALRRDCILTNKFKFGSLAFNTQLVLNTWSGLLMHEDSMPDDRTNTEGVLVGIQPNTDKSGIG
ncbi:hypothetical protein C8J57DRAFT_1088677, partial [Mycena rebaudengoi]